MALAPTQSQEAAAPAQNSYNDVTQIDCVNGGGSIEGKRFGRLALVKKLVEIS